MYVMWSPTRSEFKIGCGDVSERLRSHRTACPDIELVAAVTNYSAEAIEGSVHGHFTDERVGDSEWFKPSARLRAWVDRFAARPNTSNREEDIAHSYSTPDLWPWFEPAAPSLLDGQMAFSMELGPYVAVEANGVPGQTSAVSEDWYTPPRYVEAVRELFGGEIDLDPASCAEANLTVRALNIYTAEVDGLRHRWFGRVYLNPPWGRSTPAKGLFVRKAIAAYEGGEIDCAVLALNSNATTSAWFEPLFSYPICFPNHRVEHYGPGGKGGAPNSGTVFIYLGRDIGSFVRIFSRFGRVVPAAWPSDESSTALAENYE